MLSKLKKVTHFTILSDRRYTVFDLSSKTYTFLKLHHVFQAAKKQNKINQSQTINGETFFLKKGTNKW